MEKKFPIVILPGWRLGSERFANLSEGFKSAGYPTYIIDFPGFESGKSLTRVLHLIDYVKFLDKFLHQKRIHKAIFICHSFGGRVALKFLSQEPQRAYALVLSGTPGYKVFRVRVLVSSLITPIGKVVSFIPPFIFFRKVLARALYRFSGTYDYYKTDGMLRQTFKNIIGEPLIDYMKKIRVPTLLIWGGEDKIVPLRIAEKMQHTIKNSKLITIPGESHNFCYKNPSKFVQPILEFLSVL